MKLRTLLAFGLGSVAATAAPAQTNLPAADKAAMERALQQADGPRKRILEAARMRAGTATAPPSTSAAATAASVVPKARGETSAPSSEVTVIVTLSSGVEPVALPASANVATVPTVEPAEAMATPATMISLPPPAPPEAAASAAPAIATAPTAAALPPPRLVSKVEPDMPSHLFRRGSARTEVVVDMTINTDGSVSDASVRSSSSPELDSAVLDAVRQWRYEPQPFARAHVVRLVITPS